MKTIFSILTITYVVCSLGETRPAGFSDQMSSWAQNLGFGKTFEEHAVVPVRRMVDGVRDRFQRESPKDHLSHFVKRVQSILEKLLPSKNFVEDLMGLPKPGNDVGSDLSNEVSKIIKQFSPEPAAENSLQKPNRINLMPAREFPTVNQQLPNPPVGNYRPARKVFYKPGLTKTPQKYYLNKPRKPTKEPMYFINSGNNWYNGKM